MFFLVYALKLQKKWFFVLKTIVNFPSIAFVFSKYMYDMYDLYNKTKQAAEPNGLKLFEDTYG